MKVLPGDKQFEPEEFLRRTKAAQCLQSSRRVRGCRLVARSSRDPGLSLFRNSELGGATHRAFDRGGISGRARDRVGV